MYPSGTDCIYYTYAYTMLSLNWFVIARTFSRPTQYVEAWCSELQCAAVCCNVMQCVAVRCSVLQCVAVSLGQRSLEYDDTSATATRLFRNTRQHTATHGNALQHTATN